MKRKARTRMEVMDTFLMGLLRQAREHGIQEERQRVVAFLAQHGKIPYCDGPWFADAIERGEHDGGRTFTAYRWTWPEDEDSTEPNGNGNPAKANGQGVRSEQSNDE